MNGTPLDTTIDLKTARELLAAHTAELLALADTQVRRNTIDGERSVELTFGLQEAFAPLLPHLDTTFLPAVAAARRADLSAAAGLSRVFLAADVIASAPWTPAQVLRRKELARRAAQNDRSLVLWFRSYLSQDEAGLALLAEVTPGTGLRDDARDVSRTGDDVVVRMDAGTIPATVGPWTRESVREASAEALELLTLLGEPGNAAGSPADLRNRAFTRWANTYDRLVNVGRFLAGENPELGVTFDGIHTPGRKKKAVAEEAPEAPEQPVTPEEIPS